MLEGYFGRKLIKGIEAVLKNCKLLRKLMLEGYFGRKLIKTNDTEFPEVLYLEDITLSGSWIRDDSKEMSSVGVFEFG